MQWLFRTCGYDDELVYGLGPAHARAFEVMCSVSVAGALLAGLGLGYGMWLAVANLWAALAVAVAGGLMVFNMLRLFHASSGFPIHLPFEDIDTWRPAFGAPLVFFAFGAVLLQPWVLLFLGHGGQRGHAAVGLIAEGNAAWAHPGLAGLFTVLCGLLLAAPAWLRFFYLGAVRAHERARWLDDREFVDDAFAEAQAWIEDELREVPGFVPPLAVHYADPPYNTLPLLYGYDARYVEKDSVHFVRPWQQVKPKLPETPEPEGPLAPPAEAAPAEPPAVEAPEEPPVVERPPPAAPRPVPLPTARSFDWTPPVDASAPPAHAFFDMGRLPAAYARRHTDEVATFVSALTGQPEDEVRGLLRVAPDDMPVHQLFSDFKDPAKILAHDAGFALEHGLAPVLSIIVDKPVEQVERRLRAAAPERRLSGVFVAELARKMLGRDVSSLLPDDPHAR